jgi:hypothetical protein
MGRMPPLTAVLVIGTSGAGIVTGREPNPGPCPGRCGCAGPGDRPGHPHMLIDQVMQPGV